MSSIHWAAAKGFGAKAATYSKGRPGYPAALDAWLHEELGLSAGQTVLDLGAGTGKFVPWLLATGAQVLAVEPVAQMLAHLAESFLNVIPIVGSAERIPLVAGAVDAVICAQAFHWFATGEAMAEIKRILKPGGVLGLVWNLRDETTAWVSALSRILAPYEGDTPRYHQQRWRSVFPAEGFGPLRERRFRYEHIGAPEHVVFDRVMSVSFIAALPAPEQERVAAQLRALIATSPDLAGKDSVTFPYETVAFSCRKIA